MPRLPAVQRFITPGGMRIYRIACKVMPQLTGRVYLVLGAGTPTLVDTGSGYGRCTRNILDGLASVRRDFDEPVDVADVGRILLTHGHIDHCGGLVELLRLTGAEVGIHPIDAPAVAAPEEFDANSLAALTRFAAWAGVPDEEKEALLRSRPGCLSGAPSGVSVDCTLDDGRTFDGLRVLHTPGHAPGHVVLIAEDVLLCGDHILAHTVPQQSPEHVVPGAGLRRYLDSLERVRQAGPFRLGLAGHEPVIQDVDHRIDVLRQWQSRRNDDLVKTLTQAGGPRTAWEACRSDYRRTEGIYLLFALLDTAARLEFLEQEGRVVGVDGNKGESGRWLVVSG